MIKIFLMALLILTYSCSKKKSETTSVANPGTSTDGGTSGGGGIYPTASPTADANCTGSISDGEDDIPYDGKDYPLHMYNVALSGQVSWMPGLPAFRPEDKSRLSPVDSSQCFDYNGATVAKTCAAGKSNKCYYCLKSNYDSSFTSTRYVVATPLKKDVWPIFSNDGDTYLRVKMNDPKSYNLNGVGGAFCYGRVANSTGTYVPSKLPFTKIKFDIYARVLQKNSNCVNCTENDYSYTSTRIPIRMGYEMSSVNKCSEVIRIPSASLISNSTQAVVIEIANVYTNSACLEAVGKPNEVATVCPYYTLNTKNCWFATLQIATNETNFFKGVSRSNVP